MIMNYQFRDTTGEVVTLDIVRAEYYLALVGAGEIVAGDKCGEWSFFEALTWAGIASTRTGAFDKKMFSELYADDSQALRGISLNFLNGQYTFECWRG